MRADHRETYKNLYPMIEPYDCFYLDVGDGHSLYVEQSGNPTGYPVVFVHGGPGGGSSPVQRRFFNPELYRIILFDQRGCGRSLPHACLKENTSRHLVEDMEYIRQHLSIEKWGLFGGSWGSTLALLYAIHYPEHVFELILRGIFLMQQYELNWFYQDGTNSLFPEAYEDFQALIPREEQGDLIKAYYQRLTGDLSLEEKIPFAQAWSLWEGSTVTLIPDHMQKSHAIDPDFAYAFSRIEAHYFYHKGFLDRDDYILHHIDRIRQIRCVIVQGRYDAICPPRSAWKLKKALPRSKLILVPVAGHSAFEPAVQHQLLLACDQMADHFKVAAYSP